MTSENDDLLVFDYEALGGSVTQLFEDLAADGERRNQFKNDPIGVLSELAGLPTPLTPSESNYANRFLFALLSNDRFMQWAENWQREYVDRAVSVDENLLSVTLDREQTFKDLAEAITRYGDRELLSALASLDIRALGDETPDRSSKEMDTPATLDIERSILNSTRFAHAKMVNVNAHATVNYTVAGTVAFAVIAVVVFAMPVVIPTVVPQREPVTRVDLQRLSASILDELRSHARTMREGGEELLDGNGR